MASQDNEYSYPNGSPFPPGEEPSLTHTVNVFWTIEGDIDSTEVMVNVGGERPTQIEGIVSEVKSNKECPIHANIVPDCNYHFLFVREDMEPKTNQARVVHFSGTGTLIIRVYGFEKKDYYRPPTIRVRYYQKKSLLGETYFTTHEISDKIRRQDK